MTLTEEIYSRSSTAIQNLLVSTYGLRWRWIRFGPGFSEHLRGFRERETYDKRQWDDWVSGRLRTVLEIAARHVPFYRENWTEDEIRAAEILALQLLPVLEKDSIRQDPTQFIRDDRSRWGELVFHTSGSSGTPIAIHWKASEYRAALALREARSVGWAGASYKLPRATFSGRLVVPEPDSSGPCYRYNRAERQVYFSAFHLSRDTAPRYVEALHRHKTEWATGYAVSFYLLARFMLELELEAPPLRCVVTTSEKVTPEMRLVMESAYRCPVREEYSTVENASFACECEGGSLHVSPDAGVVEILRPDGSPCDPGEAGEVVVTGLLRTYQPLIRFRLGDLAAWSSDPCSCGRQMPVFEEVVGRLEDVVVGPDGRSMVRFHGVFIGLGGVHRGQVVQEEIDRIRVLLECDADCPAEVDTTVEERVRERLGHATEVVVERVDQIPPGPGGKFQAVVSTLRRNEVTG